MLNTVHQILNKELLIPVSRIKAQQILTTDLGLSTSELNVLFYFLEEKFKIKIDPVQPKLTVQQLINTIECTQLNNKTNR